MNTRAFGGFMSVYLLATTIGALSYGKSLQMNQNTVHKQQAKLNAISFNRTSRVQLIQSLGKLQDQLLTLRACKKAQFLTVLFPRYFRNHSYFNTLDFRSKKENSGVRPNGLSYLKQQSDSFIIKRISID